MIQSIAIDGPAGAGKSTIAKKAAKELSFTYVDTGAMFRAMAVYMADHGISQDDEKSISAACDDISIEIEYEDGVQQIILNGVNVTGRLREERIGNMTSAISVYPAVRTKLLELQRQIAATKSVIMDGRDIGTCVLPDAVCKIYLTASVTTRAKRRYDELVDKGIPADMEAIKKDIEERDYRDMHRDVAPLKQADDAVLIDSSDMDINQVTAAIIKAYRDAIKE